MTLTAGEWISVIFNVLIALGAAAYSVKTGDMTTASGAVLAGINAVAHLGTGKSAAPK